MGWVGLGQRHQVKPIIYELDEDEVDDDLFAMGAPGYGEWNRCC